MNSKEIETLLKREMYLSKIVYFDRHEDQNKIRSILNIRRWLQQSMGHIAYITRHFKATKI